MLVNANPHLDRVTAEKRLSELCQFFQGDPDLIFLEHRDNNFVTGLLTGFCHSLELWKLAHGVNNRSSTESQFHSVQEFLLFMDSVKDNIDPTEASSGFAALLKTILMIQKKTIHAKANFTHLNPKIDPPGQDQVAIPMRSKEWNITNCLAVLKDYGASRNNDALVSQEAILKPPVSTPTSQIFLSDCPIIISGQSTEAVRSYCDVLSKSLSGKGTTSNLADVAYNLAMKQKGFEYSLTFVSRSIEQLQSDLKRAISGATALNRTRSQEPYVVLCFGGQDGFTAHLSKALYDNSVLLQRHLVSYSTISLFVSSISLSMKHLISGICCIV